jgi:DNA replication protein DnaC
MKPLRDHLSSLPIRATAGELAVDADAGRTPVCERCQGAGWLSARTGENLPYIIPCECTTARIAAREAAQRRQEHELLLARLQQQFGRLAYCTLEDFNIERPYSPVEWAGEVWEPEQQRVLLDYALKRAVDHANGCGGWLYLAGPCGAGKSHLAASIVRARVEAGKTAAYASVPDLLQFIKAGFADGSSDARMNALKTVDVLLLDDLGTENPTEWVMEQLFVLINHRYLHDLTTYITSNVRLDQIPMRIGSRIADLAEEIVMPISDYRKREKAV